MKTYDNLPIEKLTSIYFSLFNLPLHHYILFSNSALCVLKNYCEDFCSPKKMYVTFNFLWLTVTYHSNF